MRYREFEFHTDLSPFGLFHRIERGCDHAFLLESLGEDSAFSRFTYIGADPDLVVSGEGDKFIVSPLRRGETEERVSSRDRTPSPRLSLFRERALGGESPYASLRKFLPKVDGLPTHYHGGLVGYVTYDGTSYFEPAFAGRAHPAFPKFEFGLYLDGFLYDKREKVVRYFTLGEDRRDHFRALLNRPYHDTGFTVLHAVHDMEEGRYQKAFNEIQQHILAGDVFQTVFSIGFQWDVEGSPVAVYRQLREINPSPHMYCIKLSKRYALGASPELLFRSAGREIEHFGTLAGTVKRGKTPEEDEQLARQLINDEKEAAEHMMLVDLARNDVGKVAEFGSVRVEKLMAVKCYSHVQHLSTEIRGTLRKGLDSFDVLASCAPAGTLTGAPKIETMKIIAALEASPRGIYGGSVGYFSVNGDAMFAIAIRSLFVAGSKAYTRSGSGIVYDSVCEKEYEEIMNKHKAMERALELASTKTRVPPFRLTQFPSVELGWPRATVPISPDPHLPSLIGTASNSPRAEISESSL